MSTNGKDESHVSARKKFLSLSLESTRKSYYPQLQRQLEIARENEKKLQLLIDNLPARIGYVDNDERYVFVNRNYETALGLSRTRIFGKTVAEILGNENYDRLRPFIRRALAGEPVHFDISLFSKDKQTIWLHINYVPDINAHGDINGFYDLTMDITEKKLAEAEKAELEKRLLHSQKMEAIGMLAGGIAHDFNNILSGIFGFSQLAEKHIHDPEKAGKDLHQIIRGAQKAADLVQQILAVSRTSANEKQPVLVGNVVKEALKLLRATIPATIAIHQKLPSRARVMGDPTKIHQVIMNLCTNAYQAMRDTGGDLWIILEDTTIDDIPSPAIPGKPAPGKYIRLDVRDTGPGIGKEILHKIFDPYFTTKQPGQGTGLGLAVVFGIVEEHQGHIDVDSAPGAGSTFSVYLPAEEERQSFKRSEKNDRQALRGMETLILVDDEQALRRSTQELLEDLGYRVFAYSDGIEAFEQYQKDPWLFDLIITDMTMPGLTGLALSQKILALRPDQPIVLCTGYSEAIDRQTCLDAGIRAYMEKPFTIKELAGTLRNLLDSKDTAP